ncbi:MAG: tetratricopeptide repeat protein [Anaerolineae bacterium]|nr:tetratricopeptide repeat protein [Anaerolineae bacterium]
MSDVELQKEQAKEAMESADYDAAIRFATEALETERENLTLYLTRGMAYYLRKRFAQAKDDFTAVLALQGNNLDALLMRGNAQLQLGQAQAAIADYDEFLTISPDHPEAPYGRRAAAYTSLGRFGEALDDYAAAIERSDDPAKLYFSRATLRYHLGDFPGVVEDCGEAIQNGYESPEAYAARGSAYVQLGLLPEAIADYTEAIDLDKRDADAYYNRGAVYLKMNKFEEAITDFSHVLRIDSTNLQAYYARATAYFESGDYRSARRDFSDVLKRDPNHVSALHKRGQSYRMRGKYEQAVADLQRASELLPNQPAILADLGEVQMLLGDTHAAIASLKHALLLHRQHDFLYTQLLALLLLAFFQADDLVQTQRYREMLAAAGITPKSAAQLAARFGWDEALTTIAAEALHALDGEEK